MNATELIIGKEFPQKVIPLIQQAKKSIDIIVYDWRWYSDQIGSDIQKFNNAIVVAKRKGIEVRAIVNSPNIASILNTSGITAKVFSSKRTLHVKNMLIDNETAIIGSHNYTMNAFTLNYEVSIITQKKEVVNRLRKFFDILWSY